MKQFYVYIVTNKYRTTFYVGITNDLNRRSTEYNESKGSIFTSKYNLTDLVYYETFSDINQAIYRERQLKNWKKDWKLKLIKEINPNLETIQMI